LSYDEKPLLLFQKLKDAKKNPVFMLKHIKDIRSPIAVAQQKHAARKASSVISSETTATAATAGHHKPRTITRPPKLEVHDLSTPPLNSGTGLSPQPGWPEPGILSPAVDAGRNDDLALTPASAGVQPSQGLGALSQDTSKSVEHAREMPASSGISYAVAIYPYMAEQEDEFDVVV
jgi:protein STE50